MKEGELELVRERVAAPDDKPSNRGPGKQTLKLKRIGEWSAETVLKAGGTVIAGLAGSGVASAAQKKVIVMGAGIAGLSCAYELKRRGHDVTVLEASGRAGGHVRTFHDPVRRRPVCRYRRGTFLLSRATRNTGGT